MGDGFGFFIAHLSKDTMLNLAEEVTGRRELPGFSRNVLHDEELNCYLRPLHEQVMQGSREFDKEENLLLLLSLLLQRYGQRFESGVPACREEIDRACAFMEEHFAQRIGLEQICRHVGLSKSTLLRAFTKSKGITPYRYLENIRIGQAKKLLEQGVPPVEAALQTGFSDQSHFANFFQPVYRSDTGCVSGDIFRQRGWGGNIGWKIRTP
jgi:AraC-like DNA-binding protein